MSDSSIKWRSAFDLKDEGYRHEVKKVYQRIYSDYNEDELDNLIVEYNEKIGKYSPAKYRNNTLNLFVYFTRLIRFRFVLIPYWNGMVLSTR